MPRPQTQERRQRQTTQQQVEKPARAVQVLIQEFGRITDLDQKVAYAKQLTETEFKTLIDWAYDRHEEEKRAAKDYKAARLLIKERSALLKEITPTGDTVDAEFSARTSKAINSWGVWLKLKKTTMWSDADAKTRKAVFNQCFKVTGDAAEVLGQSVIDSCTEMITDDFAVLKLKRR